MKRRVFNILSAGAVVVCVLIGGSWLRSWWVADFVSYKMIRDAGYLDVSINSVQQSIQIGYMRTPGSLARDERAGWSFDAFPAREVRVLNDHWGFGFEQKTDLSFAYREIWFPHWLAMLAFAVLPLAWFVARRRLRRRLYRLRNGLCLQCGYDLRASEGKCPECGMAIPADVVRRAIG